MNDLILNQEVIYQQNHKISMECVLLINKLLEKNENERLKDFKEVT
jgi:hypothetical protein